MFHSSRWLPIATVAMLVPLFGQPHSACAQALDPSTLHIGPGTTTEPVQLTGVNTVTVTQVSGGATPLDTPWKLILGIPNATNTFTTPVITSGDPNVPVPATSFATMSAGQEAYSQLGISGTDQSNSFTNWAAADKSLTNTTANSFGLFDYNINQPLTASSTDTFTFNFLPVGTFVIAFGTDSSSGLSYATAFTNAGLVVPEPGPFVGAGVVTLMGLGYTWRRRRAIA